MSALDSAQSKAHSSSQLVFAALPNGRRLALITYLADHHNMAAAAREFQVTQAAISAGVKALEDRLGLTLFARSARGLIATSR